VKTHLALLASSVVLFACSAQPTYRAQPTVRSVTETAGSADAVDEEEDKAAPAVNNQTTPPAETVVKTPAAPVAPAVRSSQGTGGAMGMQEVAFTDSTGLASSYKINVPADAGQKVYGLHVHLHGDGGGGYRDFPNKETRYDLIGVTVKAPNTNLQWGRTVGRQHALYVNELIQKEVLKKYNINLDKIYFSGVSGGAYFLMGSFIPEFGANYNSAAMIMCGGEPPRVAFADPKMLGKWRLHFEVTAGERQDILTSVQSTINAYKSATASAGVAADVQAKLQTVSIQGNGGHCEFDGVSYTTGIQQAIDTKFKDILPL
jgi:hypothetical protein